MGMDETMSARWSGLLRRVIGDLENLLGTTDAKSWLSAAEQPSMDLPEPRLPAPIGSGKGIANGEPILFGTRIRVSILYAMHVKAGMSVEEIAREYPHLSSSQIESALAYGQANSEEMEGYLLEDEREDRRHQ